MRLCMGPDLGTDMGDHPPYRSGGIQLYVLGGTSGSLFWVAHPPLPSCRADRGAFNSTLAGRPSLDIPAAYQRVAKTSGQACRPPHGGWIKMTLPEFTGLEPVIPLPLGGVFWGSRQRTIPGIVARADLP